MRAVSSVQEEEAKGGHNTGWEITSLTVKWHRAPGLETQSRVVTRTGPVDSPVMTRQSKVTAKWKGSLGRSSNGLGAGLAKTTPMLYLRQGVGAQA